MGVQSSLLICAHLPADHQAGLKRQQINREDLPEKHLWAIKRQARAQITGHRNDECTKYWARWHF